MRTKSNITVWFLSIAAIIGIGLGAVSCQPEGLTDRSEFSLYYPGISDIGPSTSMTVNPTWHGSTPSDFEIYKVTLDGAAFTPEGEVFVINPEKGAVSLQNTESLKAGLYLISVACKSDGKRYEFPDAISINMMNEVPSSIKLVSTLDPFKLTLEDVFAGKRKVTEGDSEKYEALPTAQIVTEGDHISIRKFLISKIYRDGMEVKDADTFFTLSEDKGVLALDGGNKDFIPGVYQFDFILTTRTVDEKDEKGIFTREQNGFQLEVTSAPMLLTYEPAVTKAMLGKAFTSSVPALVGSREDLKFTLAAEQSGKQDEIMANVKVNEADGTISLSETHTLVLGETYKISINVHNIFGDKVFKDALTFEVVKEIKPITKFSYDDVMDVIEGTSFENPVKEIDGDEISFSFVDLDEKLGDLELDPATGTVSAKAGNQLPAGTYTITVQAQNLATPSFTASFQLKITANPNKFTFVNWGNNLDLTPAGNYASQFRFRETLTAPFTTPAPTNDIPEGVKVKYEIVSSWANFPEAISIDPATGVISYEHKSTMVEDKEKTNKGIEMLVIKVTAGEGELAVSKQFPVAFHNVSKFTATDKKKYTLEYTPFVIKANPKVGGRSGSVKLYDDAGQEVSLDLLSIDFKRNICYLNLNGPATHLNGTPKDDGSFIRNLWNA